MIVEGSDIDKEVKALKAEIKKWENELNKIDNKLNYLSKISELLYKSIKELKAETGLIAKLEKAKKAYEDGGYIDDEGTFDKGILKVYIDYLNTSTNSLGRNKGIIDREILVLEEERIHYDDNFRSANIKYSNYMRKLGE